MMSDSVIDTIFAAMKARERASRDYRREEWTPCPNDCSYCNDPFYGHPYPHARQTRVSDGMTAGQFVDLHRE